MKIADELRLSRGVVRPRFVSVTTGDEVEFSDRHNTLSFMAAEAVASAFGGDPSYIPAKVGIIYGDKPSMPTESVIGRSQSWDDLKDELGSSSGDASVDVQVVNFSYAPTLGPEPDSSSSGDSGDGGDYSNILPGGSNAITFHAVSNSQDAGAMFNTEAFSSGSYIYQCLLLGYHDGKYYIIARASLKEGDRYLQKPDGFEVALDWTVVFH